MNDTEFITKEAALACFSDWIDRYGHEHSADEMTEYQRIEELPAADVRPVVRGRWEKLGKYDSGFVGVTDDGDQLCLPTSKCSNCKKHVAMVMWRNFCPNCGADMRGEQCSPLQNETEEADCRGAAPLAKTEREDGHG